MKNKSPLPGLILSLVYEGMEFFGRYYSDYRGFVSNNEDPDNLGRVKLVIPEVGGDQEYEYWAYPKNVFSGQGYGSQLIPQKGEMVWVSFESGHPDAPIYALGHRGTGEIPEGEDYADKNSYWFTSPGGITVMINDTKKYANIYFKGEKQSINLNENAVSLVHDKKVSLGSKDASKEAAVLGDSHNKHEKKTLQAIQKLTVNTPMGPSSFPVNIAAFKSQEELIDKQILSKKVELD